MTSPSTSAADHGSLRVRRSRVLQSVLQSVRRWSLGCVAAGCAAALVAAACAAPAQPSGVEPGVDGAGQRAAGSVAAAAPPVVQQARGKQGAPVVIAGRTARAGAVVQLRFEAAGDHVSVEVRGVDGLDIKSAQRPVVDAAIEAGDARELRVDYVAPQRASDLVITVTGRFGGMTMMRVGSLTVPAVAAAAATGDDDDDGDDDGALHKSRSDAGVSSQPSADIVVIDGQRLRLLPAKEPAGEGEGEGDSAGAGAGGK